MKIFIGYDDTTPSFIADFVEIYKHSEYRQQFVKFKNSTELFNIGMGELECREDSNLTIGGNSRVAYVTDKEADRVIQESKNRKEASVSKKKKELANLMKRTNERKSYSYSEKGHDVYIDKDGNKYIMD